jgi:hypothetical protein
LATLPAALHRDNGFSSKDPGNHFASRASIHIFVADGCSQVASCSTLRTKPPRNRKAQVVEMLPLIQQTFAGMISAMCLPLNQRRAMTRHVGQIQPMKKWIILNSFYAVPFAVIIRQAPLSAMLHLQAIPKHKPILVPHWRRSVEALSPLGSAD